MTGALHRGQFSPAELALGRCVAGVLWTLSAAATTLIVLWSLVPQPAG